MAMKLREWFCNRYHRKTSPRRDELGLYVRCLDCGRRIPWTDPSANDSRG